MGLIIPQGVIFADTNNAVINESSIQNTKALETLLKNTKDKFKEDDEISVIVQINNQTMKEKYGINVPDLKNLRTKEGLDKQITYAKFSQLKLQRIMDDHSIDYTITETYDTVLNGFALTTTYAEAKRITQLPEVKRVEYNRVIPAPKIEKINMFQTRDNHSNQMVQALKAWEKNYTGKHQLIAIIDSGADPYHEVLISKAVPNPRITDEDEIQNIIQAKELSHGKYFNAKIPFGFNYAERNTNIKELADASHGMHVAGIIAANIGEKDDSKYLRGVVPDAQLAIMRVFGGGIFGGGTTPEIYNKAIDDAVKLGVDSINMSLGATNTTDSRLEETTTEALQNAKNAGILVSIAAGNDGFMGFGLFTGPDADYPNSGLINSPSVSDISLSVASVDNASIKERGMFVPSLNRRILFDKSDDKQFPERLIEIVHVNYGYDEDYLIKDTNTNSIEEVVVETEAEEPVVEEAAVEESVVEETAEAEESVVEETTEAEEPVVEEAAVEESVVEETAVEVLNNTDSSDKYMDLSGKYALIKRGSKEGASDMDFSVKVLNAEKHGAIGVIVYDNVESTGLVHMAGLEEVNIPSLFISKADGEALVEQLNKSSVEVEVSSKEVIIANPNGYGLSSFSSWGITEEGNFKPDISAPGGKIYSSINNNTYKVMSGTSMATPHVTGGIAVVKQYVEEKFPSVQNAEKQVFIKNLLMSTATPHKFSNGSYGSPRGQGAGLMSLDRATNADVVAIGTNNISSINLRDITENTFTVSGKLKNYSSEDRTFNYYAVLNTDEVKEGHVTLTPKNLRNTEGNKQIITVSANSEQDFAITFTLTDEEIQALQNDMPNGFFLEGYVFFESTMGKENVNIPFVGFKGVWDDLSVIEDSIYDLLANNNKPLYYEFSDRIAYSFTHLGTKYNTKNIALGELSDSTYENPKFDKSKLAFSPNNDGDGDEVRFVGTFLRNYKDFEIKVYSAQDPLLDKVLYRVNHEDDFGMKNYFVAGLGGPNFTSYKNHWKWDGTNLAGEQLPDGKYVMRVSAKADGNSKKMQNMDFNVELDTTYPRIVKSSYDENAHTYTLEQVVDEGTGIREAVIEYTDENEVKVCKPDENNVFYLNEKVDIKKARIRISDYAFNTIDMPVDKSIRTGNERIVIVKPVLYQGKITDDKFNWEIQDENGNPIKDSYNMEVGNYKLIISNIDEDYELSDGKKVIDFEITDEDYTKIIKVNFKRKGRGKALIVVENISNVPFDLFLIDKNNASEYQITPYYGGYEGNFEGYFPPGTYMMKVRNLDAENYFAYTENKEIIVSEGDAGTNINHKLSIIKKRMQDCQIIINRGDYAKAFDINLIGSDLNHTRYDVHIEEGVNAVSVQLPKNIKFNVYTSNYEEKGFGTFVVEQTFNLSHKTLNLDITDVESDIVPLDKKLLKIYIEQARKLEERKYVLATYEEFEQVLYNAQKLDLNPNATQVMIDDMAMDLKTAMNELVLRSQGITKYDLKLKIEEAQKIYASLDDTYTDDSKEFLILAIEGAAKTYQSKEAKHNTQKHLQETINMLERAIENISKKDGSVDKSTLNYLIKDMENILNNKYLYESDSIKNLYTIYESSKEISENSEATKEDVNDAISTLKTYLNVVQSKADKTKLKNLVSECDNIKLIDYELEGRHEFRVALNHAREVIRNKRALDAEINKAIKELKEERAKLVKFGEEPSEENNDNNEGTGNDNSGNGNNGGTTPITPPTPVNPPVSENTIIEKEKTPKSAIKPGIKVDTTAKKDSYDMRLTEEVKKKIKNSVKDKNEVTLDISDNKEIKKINISKDLINTVGTKAKLGIMFHHANVKLDSKVIEILNESKDTSLAVDIIKEDQLTKEQRKTLGKDYNNPIVDINIYSGTNKIKTFDGGKLKISIPYTLKSGEKASEIKVWYIKDNGEITAIISTYNEKTKSVEFETNHLSKYVVSRFPFKDITENNWSYTSIAYAYNNNLLKGISDTQFNPNGNTTRAMLVTILYRLSGEKVASKSLFTDVKENKWYTDAVKWAAKNNIVNGFEDNTFRPNETLTREQFVTILYRYAKLNTTDLDVIKSYADYNEVSSYAKAAMNWAVHEEIINGSDNKLSPTNSATRAQMAVILKRFIEK